MAKKKTTKKDSTKLEELDIEKKDEKDKKEPVEVNGKEKGKNEDLNGKVTVSQYIKDNNVSKDDFYNKLIPNLKELDYNNIYYNKTDLDKLIKGD